MSARRIGAGTEPDEASSARSTRARRVRLDRASRVSSRESSRGRPRCTSPRRCVRYGISAPSIVVDENECRVRRPAPQWRCGDGEDPDGIFLSNGRATRCRPYSPVHHPDADVQVIPMFGSPGPSAVRLLRRVDATMRMDTAVGITRSPKKSRPARLIPSRPWLLVEGDERASRAGYLDVTRRHLNDGRSMDSHRSPCRIGSPISPGGARQAPRLPGPFPGFSRPPSGGQSVPQDRLTPISKP